jgi:hypothetical protein
VTCITGFWAPGDPEQFYGNESTGLWRHRDRYGCSLAQIIEFRKLGGLKGDVVGPRRKRGVVGC